MRSHDVRNGPAKFQRKSSASTSSNTRTVVPILPPKQWARVKEELSTAASKSCGPRAAEAVAPPETREVRHPYYAQRAPPSNTPKKRGSIALAEVIDLTVPKQKTMPPLRKYPTAVKSSNSVAPKSTASA